MASSKRSSSRSPDPSRLWRTVLVLILLGGAYWYQQKFGYGTGEGGSERKGDSKPAVADPSRGTDSTGIEKVNGYDKLTGCRLIDHRNNDGDSFFVRHGDREFELRLYYVDAPEKYLSDRYEDQRRRVGEQAREMGGISVDQAVEIGREAKAHTHDLLDGKSFAVFTNWERVYDGERFYGFVQIPGGDEYLGEELIEQGLARIHTKGETTPDGISFYQYRDHLEAIEREAKSGRRGAWGLK